MWSKWSWTWGIFSVPALCRYIQVFRREQGIYKYIPKAIWYNWERAVQTVQFPNISKLGIVVKAVPVVTPAGVGPGRWEWHQDQCWVAASICSCKSTQANGGPISAEMSSRRELNRRHHVKCQGLVSPAPIPAPILGRVVNWSSPQKRELTKSLNNSTKLTLWQC